MKDSCWILTSEATVAKRRGPTAFPHGEHEVWPVFSIRVLLVGERASAA